MTDWDKLISYFHVLLEFPLITYDIQKNQMIMRIVMTSKYHMHIRTFRPWLLTTILKKKVSSRELLFGPTSMSTCRRCIVVYLVAWHAAKAIKAGMALVSKAFRQGRSPLLDIYRGGPFMASKSQGTKKKKNCTVKNMFMISRKNEII